MPNDTATVGLGVKRERKTRAAALQETAKGLRKVIATAEAFPGVGEGDIRTGRINVRPVQKGKVTSTAPPRASASPSTNRRKRAN